MHHDLAPAPREAVASRDYIAVLALAISLAALVLTPATPARGEAGRWIRTSRSGGETWTYTFVVGGADSPGNEDPSADCAAGIGEALLDPTAAGAMAANGVDLEATRAFLRTAPGVGTEVDTPTVGQPVYFSFSYRVVGPGPAVSVDTRALLDGAEFCRRVSDAVPASYERWCATQWQATPGTHTLRWELDFDNVVAESNEANNAASASWSSGGAFDIQAKRAYLRSQPNSGDEIASPLIGQSVYFHLDYAVSEPGTTSPIAIRAMLDGDWYCTGNHTGGAGSWLRWCTQAWVVTAGPHVLRWEMDYENQFAEADENNNGVSTAWTSASGIDLLAQRAYLRTGKNSGDEVGTPQVGQTVYLHLDYNVSEPGTGAPFALRALLDGTTRCTGTHDGRAGGWIQWCLDPYVATAGTHTLRWELDYESQVTESNEGNNAATVSWTSGAQECVADCNNDGTVTIDDIISALNIVFDPSRLPNCPSADVNGDHQVDIDEIIKAVNAALGGCG